MLGELIEAQEKVVGLKEVTKSAQEGKLRRIYIAADADRALVNQLTGLAEACQIEAVLVPTKRELGEAAGIDVDSACAALLRETEK